MALLDLFIPFAATPLFIFTLETAFAIGNIHVSGRTLDPLGQLAHVSVDQD